MSTAPPPRIDATQYLDHEDLVTTVRLHMKQRGYVLLEGLELMTPEEMRMLMRSIAGDDCTMLKFDSGEYGTSCASPDVREVRILGRGFDNALLCDVGYEWHQDGGGTGPYLTLLHCKVPCVGADTIFADGDVLFRRLSETDQEIARSHTAVYSNKYTAGGPTALDVAYGLRMSPCGTRRLRPSTRRKDGWTIGQFTRPLVETAVGDAIERLLCGAKGLECLIGLGPEESVEELSRLLRAAIGPLIREGSLDDDLRMVGPTVFAPDAVYVHRWQAGEAMLWDNHQLLHTTVPLVCYAEGERRLMWQIICKTA